MLHKLRRRHRRRHEGVLEPLESRSLLTTITVTSLADNLDDDGEMTLREAVQLSETNDEADEIVFASGLSGVINLTMGEFLIRNESLTITGNGRDQTIIDAGNNSDIFAHQFGEDLTIQSMTLRNAQGSAVNHRNGIYAVITVRDSVITGSGGSGVSASLLFSEADYRVDVDVIDSTITGSGGAGLSIVGEVSTRVENSIISGNEESGIAAFSDAYGSPDLLVEASLIQGNQSSADGGGIDFSGSFLTIADSLISGNEAQNGGGIDAATYRSFTLLRSTVSGNSAAESGGGLRLDVEGFRFQSLGGMKNSTVSGNTATKGAGVYVESFDRNLPIANMTVTQNVASGRGGGLFFASNPRNDIESNIFAGNSATNGGPDLEVTSTANAVFRKNLVGSNNGTDLDSTGALTPDGHGNFVGTNQNPIDPGLTDLVDHGLLKIHRLEPGSPALDRGSNPEPLETDQIGNPRQNGPAVDIGAIEVSPGPLAVSSVSVTEGDSGTVDMRFTIEMTETVDGPFTVDVLTVDGTAEAAFGDYVAVSETLSFSGDAGQAKQVAVSVIGDTVGESDETLFLRFQNVSDTTITLPGDVEGLILNDDSTNAITLTDGKLTVEGTVEADTIRLTLADSKIRVELNEESAEFPDEDVDSIRVIGQAGDDNISAILVTQPMVIDAGEGNDTVKGGVGDDKILGRDGNDNLRGTKGDDSILGGNGNDTLQGQFGRDTLIGGEGDDTLKGAEDADSLRGDAGNDLIEGGDGEDTLAGGGGSDTMLGEAGIDRLRGGGGADHMSGGPGNDKAGGGSGADTMIGGGGHDYLNGGDGPDRMSGGDGNDTLLGRAGHDVLLGDNGADSLKGLTGRDIIYGGNGIDSFFANSDDDILIAGFLTPATGTSVLEHLSGSLRDEWLSDRIYTRRVANIRNGSGNTSDKLNDVFLVGNRSGQNVFDDGVEDNVRGGNQTDLFFAKSGSDLLDRENSEFLEDL